MLCCPSWNYIPYGIGPILVRSNNKLIASKPLKSVVIVLVVIDEKYGMDLRSHYEVYHLRNTELSIF